MAGVFSLWDKNFDKIAEWSSDDAPIYVTHDYEDGHRASGLLRLSIEN